MALKASDETYGRAVYSIWCECLGTCLIHNARSFQNVPLEDIDASLEQLESEGYQVLSWTPFKLAQVMKSFQSYRSLELNLTHKSPLVWQNLESSTSAPSRACVVLFSVAYFGCYYENQEEISRSMPLGCQSILYQIGAKKWQMLPWYHEPRGDSWSFQI